MDTKQTIVIFRKDLLKLRNLYGCDNIKVIQNGSRESIIQVINIDLSRFPFDWYPCEYDSCGEYL